MHQTQDLHETIREMRFEAQVTVNFIKALMSLHWRAECAEAMSHLKEIDPPGWERWYDMDVQDGSWKEITIQVRERIAALEELGRPDSLFSEVILLEHRQKVILENYSKSDNQDELILELAEIQTFLDRDYGKLDDVTDVRLEVRFGEAL